VTVRDGDFFIYIRPQKRTFRIEAKRWHCYINPARAACIDGCEYVAIIDFAAIAIFFDRRFSACWTGHQLGTWLTDHGRKTPSR
jgi:hypothetical protein